MSLYDDLGVDRDASEAEIAAAYRSAARRHHPDAGGNAADFDKVQRAANILRDPAKRAEYDRTGSVDDRVDTALAQAIDLLCNAFSEAIAACRDFGAVDIVQAVRNDLAQKREQIARQREQAVAIRSRLENALGRLSYRGERSDFIGNMLSGQLRSHDARLAEMDRTTTCIERALEMAQDYAWAMEPEAEAAFRAIAQEAIAWDELVR